MQCKHCSKAFESERETAKYCSGKCRVAHLRSVTKELSVTGVSVTKPLSVTKEVSVTKQVSGTSAPKTLHGGFLTTPPTGSCQVCGEKQPGEHGHLVRVCHKCVSESEHNIQHKIKLNMGL